MGVDILIVVDAGFPLQPRKNLNSLPSITNQMLSILLRKDIERDLARRSGPTDIVVQPAAGRFLLLRLPRDDEDRQCRRARPPQAVADAAGGAGAVRTQDTRAIQLARSARRGRGCRRWNSCVSNRIPSATSARSRTCSRSSMGQHGRSRAALKAAGRRALRPRRSGAARLSPGARIRSGESGWISLRGAIPGDPNYLRFGIALQDDFKGKTIFNAAGRLDITELNSLGAELRRGTLQVGTASAAWRPNCTCRCRM